VGGSAINGSGGDGVGHEIAQVLKVSVEVGQHYRKRVKTGSKDIPQLSCGDLYVSTLCVCEIANDFPPLA
jgi:hypothetical protein